MLNIYSVYKQFRPSISYIVSHRARTLITSSDYPTLLMTLRGELGKYSSDDFDSGAVAVKAHGSLSGPEKSLLKIVVNELVLQSKLTGLEELSGSFVSCLETALDLAATLSKKV